MNGSILIPEKFKLKRRVIVVKVDDEYCTDDGCLGEADFQDRVITLCGRYKNKILSKEEREKVFFHELVHMILDSMGRERLKWSEEFVDLFAKRLYEYEKTKE